jgi:Flp pilus assembly protein TadG
MSSARRAKSRPDRGQTLVEFALIAPAFVLLMLGLLDFGRVVYADHTFSQAAREGLRVAIVEPAESSSKYAAIRAAAVNAAPGTGLAAANVTGSGCGDCFYPDGNVSGGRVVVTVARNVELLTPIIGQLLGGSMPVEARSMGFLP